MAPGSDGGLCICFYIISQILLLYEFGTIESWSVIVNNCIIFLSIAFGVVFITNSFIQQIIQSKKRTPNFFPNWLTLMKS